MTHILMYTSIFFINAQNVSEIVLRKGEWVSTNDLSPELLECIKCNNYKVIFTKQENIFSHEMNVLRKMLFETDTIAVIGVEKIFDVLNNADECRLSIKNNWVAIGDIVYVFKNVCFLRDASEIIEYNMDTEEICYKPDFYYNSELSTIIVNGYNMAHTILPSWHSSRCDNDGRIWNNGFIFPYQFFDYFSVHTDEYYNALLLYIGVLKKIFSLRNFTDSHDELNHFLADHYSYSLLFAFMIPSVSEALEHTIGNKSLEKVYNLFILNSPIHNKEKLTDIALEKMEIFLTNILNGIKCNENYFYVYQADDMPSHDIALMCYVTNMISDIRRCVINIIIKSNHWFSSICHHRPTAKIY